MNRREFMVAASGVAGGAGAATAGPPVAAQDDGGGGGETVEIVVGPGGEFVFDPEEVTIAPGTTVVWTWDSDNHNVVPDSIPDDAEWEGHEDLENSGFEYEHTFEVAGEYDYVCTPHEQAGMVGTIVVEEEGGGDGGGGGGGTEEVIVGPDGDFVFDPEQLTIAPGTTVLWTWDSDNHNVVPEDIPDDAEWEGHEPLENSGFEYEHTFEVTGEYHYICEPHAQSGMVGDIIVQEGGGGDGGGHGEEIDVHDLGVPIQKHWVGIASIFAIFTSLVFTFYLLKYGESAHTSSPGRR